MERLEFYRVSMLSCPRASTVLSYQLDFLSPLALPNRSMTLLLRLSHVTHHHVVHVHHNPLGLLVLRASSRVQRP